MPDKRRYSDRAEYNKKAVALRRHRIKAMALEYKGSKCQNCGYNRCNRAMEFHHLNPQSKEFSIASKGHSRSWQRVKAELDKCILVCSNCHQEIHAGLLQPPQVIEVEQRGELLEPLTLRRGQSAAKPA